MHATYLLARCEGRRYRRSLIGLAVVAAVVGTVVFTSAAGARRTASVHDRFLEASDVHDASVDLGSPRHASDIDAVRRLQSELAAVEGVERVTATVVVQINANTTFDFSVLAGPDDLFEGVSHPHIVEGRAPDAAATDEVALSELAASELGLTVGDSFEVATMHVDSVIRLFEGEADSYEMDGPILRFEVVGVARDYNSLSPGGTGASPMAFATPALFDDLGDVGVFGAQYRLDSGGAPVDARALEAVVGDIPDDAMYHDVATGLDDSGTERAFQSIAWGLALFVAVSAVAGLLALSQAASRHVQLSRDAMRDARAMGMTRWQRAVAIGLPPVTATAGGLVAGAIAAVALSPRFPVSVARRAELDRGVDVDPAIHVAAVAVAIVIVGTIVVALARRAARSAPEAAQSSHSLPAGSVVSRSLSWMPPPAAIGVRSVAGRRLAGIRPATAITGAVLAVAGSVAVVVFAASHTMAVDHPERYGWTWEVTPDVFTDDPWALVEQLADDERIDAVGGVFCDEMSLSDQPVPTCAFVARSGTIGPMVLSGRAPSSPDEVALGTTTSRQLGVGIGDTVHLETVANGIGQDELMVVGTSVNPLLGREGRPSVGAVVFPETMQAALGAELTDVDSPNLVLDLDPTVDPDTIRRELEAEFPIEFSAYSDPLPPELLVQVERARPTLFALVAFLGVLGVIGLVHFLALSIRRRRGELAVLRALGFARRQVRATVTWQAMAVTAVGILAGVPLGVVVGRWSWLTAVDNLGIVDTPATPVVALLTICAVVLVGAAAVSVVPGLLAGRRHPAPDLRTE